MSSVEFAILGAGAIGSIVGARLAQGGGSIVILARGRRGRRSSATGYGLAGLRRSRRRSE